MKKVGLGARGVLYIYTDDFKNMNMWMGELVNALMEVFLHLFSTAVVRRFGFTGLLPGCWELSRRILLAVSRLSQQSRTVRSILYWRWWLVRGGNDAEGVLLEHAFGYCSCKLMGFLCPIAT